MATPKKKEKLSIENYKKMISLRASKRFKFELYPWQVLVPLLIPIGMLIFLITTYILWVKNNAG